MRSRLVGLSLIIIALILGVAFFGQPGRSRQSLTTPARPDRVVVEASDSLFTLDSLSGVLRDSRIDHRFFPLIDSVSSRLSRYQRLIDQAHLIPNRGRYQIDVIGQIHEAPDNDAGVDILMHYSQWRTRQLLDSLEYQAIGVEGVELDSVTWQGMFEELLAQIQQPGKPAEASDTLYAKLLVITGIGHADGFLYLHQHPQALMVGVDDLPLNALHAKTYQVLRTSGFNADQVPPVPPPAIVDPTVMRQILHLRAAVRCSRDEILVAKMLLAMKKRGLQRGTIIIGLYHAPNISRILRRYGVQTIAHDTLLPSRLGSDWWK